MRTKLIEDNDLNISEQEQTDISSIVNASLEKFNLEPKSPGKQLDLSHLNSKLQTQINELCTTYKDAFASGKYDIGLYLGFSADIPTIEGAFSCEKERPMKPHVLAEIAPIMQNLIEQGVFAPADLQKGYCSNINAVAKPEANRVHLGKADSHIAKQQGVKGNNQRITLDLRKINNCMPTDPKITLPNYKTLARQFSNCICSNFDLCSMFYAIPINYDSQHKTNFWYDGKVYKMQRLPMGIKNAVYVAQKAALLTYSDANLDIFFGRKGNKKRNNRVPIF